MRSSAELSIEIIERRINSMRTISEAIQSLLNTNKKELQARLAQKIYTFKRLSPNLPKIFRDLLLAESLLKEFESSALDLKELASVVTVYQEDLFPKEKQLKLTSEEVGMYSADELVKKEGVYYLVYQPPSAISLVITEIANNSLSELSLYIVDAGSGALKDNPLSIVNYQFSDGRSVKVFDLVAELYRSFNHTQDTLKRINAVFVEAELKYQAEAMRLDKDFFTDSRFFNFWEEVERRVAGLSWGVGFVKPKAYYEEQRVKSCYDVIKLAVSGQSIFAETDCLIEKMILSEYLNSSDSAQREAARRYLAERQLAEQQVARNTRPPRTQRCLRSATVTSSRRDLRCPPGLLRVKSATGAVQKKKPVSPITKLLQAVGIVGGSKNSRPRSSSAPSKQTYHKGAGMGRPPHR